MNETLERNLRKGGVTGRSPIEDAPIDSAPEVEGKMFEGLVVEVIRGNREFCQGSDSITNIRSA